MIDPATKEKAQKEVAQNIQQLAKIREDLDSSKKELDALQVTEPAEDINHLINSQSVNSQFSSDENWN